MHAPTNTCDSIANWCLFSSTAEAYPGIWIPPPLDPSVEEVFEIDFRMQKHCGILHCAESREHVEWRTDWEYGPYFHYETTAYHTTWQVKRVTAALLFSDEKVVHSILQDSHALLVPE